MSKHQARVFFLVLVLLTGFVAGGCAIREALIYEVPVNSWFILKYVLTMGFTVFCEALALAVIRTASVLYDEEEKARRRPYRDRVRLVRIRG